MTERTEWYDTTVDADLLARFAAATGGGAGARSDGVPPMVLACAIFEAQNQARAALVPAAIQQAAAGGVHGEHDLVVHRPLAVGESLRTAASVYGVRPAGRHAAVTLRYTTVNAGDEVVAEQWWTTVFFGVPAEPIGDAAPDHRFPDDARARPMGIEAVEVDDGMARRYAEASGDWSPHHFDPDAARASGADRPFLHGLCTMALCAQVVADVVADVVAGGDPARLARIAVRFSSTTPIGERLEVATFDAGPLGVAFEATAAGTGAMVISHGRAELLR